LGREGARFDLVLMDPPYTSGATQGTLEALVEAGILAVGAVVVLERARSHPLPAAVGLSPLDERRYGETLITRFTASARDPGGPEAGGSQSA
jgi:16S rRNA (guanine966-N2)-methyltransferase